MCQYPPRVTRVLWLACAALGVVALSIAVQRRLEASCTNNECYKASCFHYETWQGMSGCFETDYDTADCIKGSSGGGGKKVEDTGNYQWRQRGACTENCEDVDNTTATTCRGSEGQWKDKDDNGNLFKKMKCDYSSGNCS